MNASSAGMAMALLFSAVVPTQPAAAPPLENAVRYMDCTIGDDANDGLSPESPLRTLQAAINAAPIGVIPEVRIGPGICPPTVPGGIVEVQLGPIGAVVRGAGADQTELVGHRLTAQPQDADGRDVFYTVEGLSLERMSAFQEASTNGGVPVLELRDCDLKEVVLGGARALVERNVVRLGLIFQRARGNGELILRESVFPGDYLSWGIVVGESACSTCQPHGHAGPVRIESNLVVGQSLILLAEEGERLMVIVRDNVFLGVFDPITTQGSVLVIEPVGNAKGAVDPSVPSLWENVAPPRKLVPPERLPADDPDRPLRNRRPLHVNDYGLDRGRQ